MRLAVGGALVPGDRDGSGGGGLLPGNFAIRPDAGLGRSCRSKAFGQDVFSIFFSMERLHDLDTISSPWS